MLSAGRERLMQILLPDSTSTYRGAITWFVIAVCKLCMLTRLELINYMSPIFCNVHLEKHFGFQTLHTKRDSLYSNNVFFL